MNLCGLIGPKNYITIQGEKPKTKGDYAGHSAAKWDNFESKTALHGVLNPKYNTDEVLRNRRAFIQENREESVNDGVYYDVEGGLDKYGPLELIDLMRTHRF